MYLKLFDDILFVNDKIPFYNFISISNKCNANCKFCDIHEKKEKKTSVNISCLIKDLKNNGAKYVHFTGGGEPFANPEIFSYLEDATKNGLNIVITTNGFFLNHDTINKFKNYNIKAIFFSIDSHDSKIHDKTRNVNGLFYRATQAINEIKISYPYIKIVINHVLNHDNISQLSELIKMKNEVNYDYLNMIIVKECPEYYFSLKQIKEYNSSLQKIKALLKEYDVQLLYDNICFFENGCYLNDGTDLRKNNIPCKVLDYCSFIDCVSGEVYPCDCSIHRDFNYYSIGNIKKMSIKEIFNSAKAENLRKELLGYSLCKGKCDYANMYLNKMINERK